MPKHPARRWLIAIGACLPLLGTVTANAASPGSGQIGSQPLSTGSSGSAVRALQTDLQALGYFHGTVTGIYGATTAQAVSALQSQHGMASNGVASLATQVLAIALNEPVLRLGDQGVSVGVLQRRLKAWGDYVGSVNVIFGASTRQAVIWFQQGWNLQATGVVDLATWIHLFLTPPGSTAPASGGSKTPSAPSTPSGGTSSPPSSGGSGTSSKSSGETVLGYWVQPSSSPTDYPKHSQYISEIGPLWYSVRTDGTVKQWWPTKVQAVVNEVHSNGGKVLALVNNMGGSGAMLQSAATRTAAVNNLVSIVQTNNLDGLNIDFEGITGYDAQGLVAFMQELHSRLHALGLLTTIDVGPRASTNISQGSLSAAYDYGALAPYVDQMAIMTYDEHGVGTGAGPVSSAVWASHIVNYALSQGVPAHKILLGIADYGYNWSATGTTTITASHALALAQSVGAQVTLDPTSGEDHFTYSSGGAVHQVWFEDASSLPSKLAIVKKDGLGGVALWVLGGEDSGYFPALQQGLGL